MRKSHSIFLVLIISFILSFNNLYADVILSEAKRKHIWLELQKADTKGIKIEPKFGLSVAKQKQIWQEIRESNRSAHRLSAEISSIQDFSSLSDRGSRRYRQKQIALYKELYKQHQNEIARRYGLTREQIEKIYNEGAINRWGKRQNEIAKQYNLTYKQVEKIYEEGLTKKWANSLAEL